MNEAEELRQILNTLIDDIESYHNLGEDELVYTWSLPIVKARLDNMEYWLND